MDIALVMGLASPAKLRPEKGTARQPFPGYVRVSGGRCSLKWLRWSCQNQMALLVKVRGARGECEVQLPPPCMQMGKLRCRVG